MEYFINYFWWWYGGWAVTFFAYCLYCAGCNDTLLIETEEDEDERSR